MERVRTRSLTLEEQWMATAGRISGIIPDSEYLSEYADKTYWLENLGNSNIIEEIKNEITDCITPWLKTCSSIDLYFAIVRMGAAKSRVIQCVPNRYKFFFAPPFQGLPNSFAVPTPFLVMKDGNTDYVLKKPIIRIYGKTRLEIRGTALRSEDGLLTVALLMLMQKKYCHVSEKVISFSVTREEIAHMLGKKHIKESTLKAIWEGLTRLNDSRMTLTNEKGLRTLGGILSGASELEEDSNFEIRIHFDHDFVNLIFEGYTKIDLQICATLRPTLVNLYMFLRHQQSFNEIGVLHKISIFKMYEYAGLGGIEDNKPVWYKRQVIKKALAEMKRREIITNEIIYSGDFVSIVSFKSLNN